MKKALKFHEQVIMPEILAKTFTKCSDWKTHNKLKGHKLVNLEIEILCPDVEQQPGLEIGGLYTDEKQKTEEPTPCDNSYESCESLSIPPRKSEIVAEISQEIKKISEISLVDSKLEIRNLKNLSVKDILLTYSDHEEELKQLYGRHIKKSKRNYFSRDIPDLIVMDIVNEKQLEAMANFAETKLVCNLKEEFYSTEVIVDAILPEWALGAFCKQFKLTRIEAIERIKLQSEYLIKMNDSD